jgi:hypothetical protein
LFAALERKRCPTTAKIVEKMGIKRVETPQRKSGESIQYKSTEGERGSTQRVR